jgi:aldehyde:ferredoxin oxidoreductase
MKENYGFNNQILRVDLSKATAERDTIGEKILRKYLGGSALGTYYLLKEIAPGTKPLSADNKIFFTTSPLTGVRFSGNARHSVTTISPLTGGLASSEAGGWWGPALKLAGLDAIAVEGVSEKPVYLYIDDDSATLEDAADLWGKTTGEVQDTLKERYGTTSRVLQIGPAGENCVRYACITNELRHFNGRGGTGAVMGHKKLRAIVIKNTRKSLPVFDPDGLKELAKYLNTDIKNHPALGPHNTLGTTRFLLPTNAGGMLPTKNFQDGSYADAEKISGEEIDRQFGDGTHTCFACTVSCKRKMKNIDQSAIDTSQYGGPEYETMGVFGPMLGINKPGDIVELNALCNSLGLDTVSTGVTISWLMEVCEKEPDILPFKYRIQWKDGENVKKLVQQISTREGAVGQFLAEGTKRASEMINGASGTYAMQVKGQEFPAHEPRGKWNVGLGMAVNAAGADHLVVAHDVVIDHAGDPGPQFSGADLSDLEPLGLLDPLPSESLSPKKIRNFVYLQQLWMLFDILDFCKFTAVPETRSYTLKHIIELMEKTTGWKTSLFDLLKCSERAIQMGRLFNYRMGFTHTDDTLPDRMFSPIGSGNLSGHSIDRVEFGKALELYYQMMGWDAKGNPTYAKFVELGIEEFFE